MKKEKEKSKRLSKGTLSPEVMNQTWSKKLQQSRKMLNLSSPLKAAILEITFILIRYQPNCDGTED